MVPPPWAPSYVVPGPSPAEIDALELAGRHKKRLGAVLMGIGSGIALAGTGMIIAGAWNENGYCGRHYYYRGGTYYYRYSGTYAYCGESALTIAGVTTAIFGAAVIVPGALVYSNGGREVAQAHRLRGCYWGSVSLRPSIARNAAGLEIVVRR
jgi:hypothetical protein